MFLLRCNRVKSATRSYSSDSRRSVAFRFAFSHGACLVRLAEGRKHGKWGNRGPAFAEKTIQEHTHDSAEDARTALDLYAYYRTIESDRLPAVRRNFFSNGLHGIPVSLMLATILR